MEDFEKFKIKPQIGDILMTRITAGIIGDTAVIEKDEELGYYVSLALIRKKAEINSYFLNYYINSPIFKHELHKKIIHVAFPKKINLGDIGSCYIKIPILTEQEKIASFLTSIDNLISTQESNISILETYNRGLISKIFKQEIRFKDDNGNEFPDWVMEKVKDLFEITRGCVLAVDNIKTNRDQMYPYPVYSSQTKNNGLMGYYSKFLYENAITWTTDGANAGTVNFRKGKFYCTNVCGVLLNKDGYANRCIAEIIACKSKRYVSYVGNPKLMNNIMAEIPILIPSLEEQEKISNFLTSLDNVLQAEKNYLEQLKTIKKGLLQQMFV